MFLRREELGPLNELRRRTVNIKCLPADDTAVALLRIEMNYALAIAEQIDV
jgi:hypothetical protein